MSLVILIALFLVASSMTLATVVNDGPTVSLIIGSSAALLTVFKVYSVRRWIFKRKDAFLLVIAGLTASLNFVFPAIMSYALEKMEASDESLRIIWLYSSALTVYCCVIATCYASRILDSGLKRRR